MIKHCYDCIIIGGGASGIVAAIIAKKRGLNVAILEKSDRIGKKILVSGNGKCNLLGTLPLEQQYNDEAVLKVFEKQNLDKLKNFCTSLGLLLREDNNRIYPYSEQSSSVLNVLLKKINELEIDVFLNTDVFDITFDVLFEIKANTDTFQGKKIILATGSKAGFGKDSHFLYSKFGHDISVLSPSLAPLITDTTYIKGLKGVRLNAKVSLIIDKKIVKETIGELLFKDNGISGSAIFAISVSLARLNYKTATLSIDFMPEFSISEVEAEIKGRFDKNNILNLDGMFHKEISNNILKRSGGNITQIITLIKNYPIKILRASSFELCQVTSGGLKINQFDLDTLQSKLKSGLFSCGEVLDVDGQCGGYNLMWALASGIQAGESV
ncbi:MAG: aminoacetone oxidase family FAD-binding enzyme [Christensenellaceae bacterium]|jgi:predicted Rossmann fold flavoprotein|nr:aminoacetone oxidase family FAD-binding enzyme [Christensenellaceae bacterium]